MFGYQFMSEVEAKALLSEAALELINSCEFSDESFVKELMFLQQEGEIEDVMDHIENNSRRGSLHEEALFVQVVENLGVLVECVHRATDNSL